MTAPRRVHLVGSFPAPISSQEPLHAWSWLRSALGDAELTAWPFDNDPNWLIGYMRALQARGVLRAVREGDFSSYDAMPIYRLANGPLPTEDALIDEERVRHAHTVLEAYLDGDGDTSPVQLSRPNPLDTALLTLVGKVTVQRPVHVVRGTVAALRILSTVRRAAAREVRDTAEFAESINVPAVWQVEAPSVLYALSLVPGPLRGLVSKVLARQIADTLREIPPHSAVLHLCYGNLADTELVTPRNTRPVVLFLNELGDRLQRAGVSLPPVHVPFAFGAQPARTTADFYAPLTALRHPWQLIAGVADENAPEASHQALRHVEASLGRPAHAVATACGLGRHSVADAERALALLAKLAHA